ncbi:cAMP-specific 3',5'-cyclic phosphodiesterase 4D [Cladochytrium tenue]|nr:cAMP-specific 3',5'-cyclic phosphodiesterase 4D [Cladochytrium tenue]
MRTAIDSHVHAALRVKHAKFSPLFLTFQNSFVEADYREYFWSRIVNRWRCFVVIASCVVLAFQLAGIFGKLGDGVTDATTTDWIVFAFTSVLPMAVISLISYFNPTVRMSYWVHFVSLLFLLVIGPIRTIARYAKPFDNAVSPAVTAPFYIVCLVASVFFLRLRFMHTLVAAVITVPTWFVLFSRQIWISGDFESQYTLSGISLLFACLVSCFMAYDLERSLRTRYLSDSRFISITRNLQSQLDGLERSLLAASGKSWLTPADLDSPLEKAILSVRSLILDGSSPNLLMPDLDVQVREGQVSVDDEQEKWLFNELARREKLPGDTADTGKVQFVSEDSDPTVEITDINDANKSRSRRNSIAIVPTKPMPASEMTDLLSSPRVSSVLSRCQEFNFPIFELSDATGGRSLVALSYHLCVSSGLLDRLGLRTELFLNCMSTIESGYHADLPFHNSLHASDVLHCVNYLSSLPTTKSIFNDLELLAIYVAASIHDFDHPGVSNNFLIASGDRKALLYNDKSVLENHHCAAAFEVMSRSDCAFLGSLDRADYKTVRDHIVEMVLATDLSQHFSLLTMFKKKVLSGETFDPLGAREDRVLLMQMMIKCSDVSNPTKSWPLYNRWIERLTQEWFIQGDREKQLGLEVSPFMNRDSPNANNPASAQSGFINFIVGPLFDAFGAWTDASDVLRGLDVNRARWQTAIHLQQRQQQQQQLQQQQEMRGQTPDGGGVSSRAALGGLTRHNSRAKALASSAKLTRSASIPSTALFFGQVSRAPSAASAHAAPAATAVSTSSASYLGAPEARRRNKSLSNILERRGSQAPSTPPPPPLPPPPPVPLSSSSSASSSASSSSSASAPPRSAMGRRKSGPVSFAPVVFTK